MVAAFAFIVGLQLMGNASLIALIYFMNKKHREDKLLTITEFKETLKAIKDSHNSLTETNIEFAKMLQDHQQTIAAIQNQMSMTRQPSLKKF